MTDRVPPQSDNDLAETVAAADENSSAAASKTRPESARTASKKVQQLGDFRVLRKLGQGGMGAVFLAHQVSLDRRCALKVMAPEIAKNKDFVKRFIREARVMAKIEHPSVVRCYAVGESKGMYYVAMEFIDGASMQDWIDKQKILCIGDALHVTIVCAQALAHAHSSGLIHRDIKPDNILVTSNGAVKVADLGLAKAIDEDQSLTQSGTGMGTPLYMPPEQARNAKHVDHRSDIYALGCTLYKFLTGKPPFKADSTMELIIAKERGKFDPAARLNKQVPEKLSLVIDKMIARDPQHRYQSCNELLTDLFSLELQNPSLSFIEGDNKVVLGNSSSNSQISGMGTVPNVGTKTLDIPRTSREEARQQKIEQARRNRNVWKVQFVDRTGKQQIKRMATDQIHRGLATRLLNETTRIAKGDRGSFLPIGSVPEFKHQVEELLHEVAEGKRKDDMKSLYHKIDRQYSRRKWWRLLGNLKSGTLGSLSLLIWIAIVAGVGYGLYIGVPVIGRMVADNVGIGS